MGEDVACGRNGGWGEGLFSVGGGEKGLYVELACLNRAYKISDSWQDFHKEVMHIKQVLVNNNYSNKTVDLHIKKFLQNKQSLKDHSQSNICIPIYYQNQTHPNCKVDERTIKNIIVGNTTPVQDHHKLRIIFYYKNIKTHNLVMKNNMAPPPTTMQQTNVVYKFICPLPHSKAEEYIGLTQTTLSRRLTMHGQNGSIYKHFINTHNSKPSREQLTDNTAVIAKANDRYKLSIKEALLIMNNEPSLNIQFDNFTNILKLYNHRNQQSQFKQANSTYSPFSPPPTENNPSPHPPFLPQATSSPILNICIATPPPPKEPENYCIVAPTEPLVLKPIANIDPPSPTTIKAQCINAPQSRDETIPDLYKILSRFGINYSNLKQVPLQDYHWWKFHDYEASLERSPSPSLSLTLPSTPPPLSSFSILPPLPQIAPFSSTHISPTAPNHKVLQLTQDSDHRKCVSQCTSLACTHLSEHHQLISSDCLNKSNIPYDQNSPTISQRIKTLVRGARKVKTTSQT